MGNITLQRGIPASLRGGTGAQREALPSVAPGDFMVALDKLLNSVGAQHPAALHLLLKILRPPGLLPEAVHGFLRVQSDRIGHGGQDFLESRRHCDEDALEHRVPLAIRARLVADTAVDFGGVGGDRLSRVRF